MQTTVLLAKAGNRNGSTSFTHEQLRQLTCMQRTSGHKRWPLLVCAASLCDCLEQARSMFMWLQGVLQAGHWWWWWDGCQLVLVVAK
jgi:hypothetical protein